MKRILSINGGGIRGIIPACTLVAVEQHSAGQFANVSILRQALPPAL
jgi:hypothetical protein